MLLLGLSAPADDDPFGGPLLRALASPGASGTRLVVSTAPSVLARAGSGIAPTHPVADTLRQMAALADGIVITTPESEAAPAASLRTLLNWLTWSAEDSPLAGKPVAVLTTSAGPAVPSPPPYCEAERMLFSAGADIVGPRTVIGRAAQVLREREDGQVTFDDPGAAVRLLFHIHRIAAAARQNAGLPPADDSRPWLL
ncbi:NAD(P)H-dependent oxidoreductase [Streptomyces sp. NPDC051162]|uniref:NAD(P)H-dependent oxidoreductase n=1 Tax=unclassified Streptomyces TaxID=2593676 RepID=UPI00344046C8